MATKNLSPYLLSPNAKKWEYIAATLFMNLIETLTIKLGISIRSLASFLRIHHSLLARFDTAERTLPGMTLPEVIEIYNLAEATQPAPDPLPNEQQRKELQQQAEWCAAQCAMLHRKLKAVQERYQQAHTLLQVLDGYEKKYGGSVDEKRNRWIEEQRYAAEKKLAANGWETQWKIRVEIGKLGREVEMGVVISFNFS